MKFYLAIITLLLTILSAGTVQANSTAIFASDVIRQSANPLIINGAYNGTWNINYGGSATDNDDGDAWVTVTLKKNGIAVDSVSGSDNIDVAITKTVMFSGTLNPGDVYTVVAISGCQYGCLTTQASRVQLKYSIVGETPTPTPVVTATASPTPLKTATPTPIIPPPNSNGNRNRNILIAGTAGILIVFVIFTMRRN